MTHSNETVITKCKAIFLRNDTQQHLNMVCSVLTSLNCWNIDKYKLGLRAPTCPLTEHKLSA
uniref:Uncharacterized protein n=1 Tax=Zea mays TaxID=4577 RepID=C0PNY3_MAIZE|nr:unknown [Zea mays]